MHPILAIRAFFLVLFGRPLPEEVVSKLMLPASTEESENEAPEPVSDTPPPEPVSEPGPEPEPAAPALREEGAAAQTLGVLQAGGRLLDFLFEDIEDYSDEDIGAAVREVHKGCRKALKDHFDLEAIRKEDEEDLVTVPEGYDPAEIRLVGQVVGQPPFSGALKHKGWRADKVRLPRIAEGTQGLVVAPAEVEIQ